MSYMAFKITRVITNCISSNASPIKALGRTYKSAISLENLHPKSSIKLTTPEIAQVTSEKEKFTGYIPINKLNITYSCSSGPGGTNVNTSRTKVDLRFKLSEADWLAPEIREKLALDHKTRINKDGFFVVKSDITRFQQLNVADSLRKLRIMIRNACEPQYEASEDTLETLRRRHEKSARQRLWIKRHDSELKKMRKSSVNDL